MWAKVASRRAVFGSISCLVFFGCAEPAREDTSGAESAVIEEQQDGPPADLPEVVQVLVNNQVEDYCTGVLVSPTRVLTAAHCTGGATFVVRAPHAPRSNSGKIQESKAKKAGSVARSQSYYEEVWKEDAATLDLETPIRIAAYPTLRDVGELGEDILRAVAVGRSAEAREAPLVKSKELEVKSGTPLGYTTGLVSTYYSSGGDSGGPLFLVDDETRKPLHVVIGIERQPDPPNEFFTRITPAVKSLVAR